TTPTMPATEVDGAVEQIVSDPISSAPNPDHSESAGVAGAPGDLPQDGDVAGAAGDAGVADAVPGVEEEQPAQDADPDAAEAGPLVIPERIALVLNKARQLLDAKRPQRVVAQEVGVSVTTLRRWLARYPQDGKSTAGVR